MKKFIFIIVAILSLQYLYSASATQLAGVPEISEIKHKEVILYATAWCGYCKKTRAFLDKNHIKYTEYDIEKSEDGLKQHKALGGQGVPTLDIKGTVIHGYSTKNMTSVFKALNLM